MNTGAVIVAAGMSSRMGDFKPMLNIGRISIAQRVVATLQQSGVEKIVMVTGFNAPALEKHLAGNGVVFLRNDAYETTQMFDSVCIGLRYFQGKCGRVLITPVDIPLFTTATVRALLDAEADWAVPVCRGKTGHPTLISGRLIPSLLADGGEGGLRGALEHSGAEMLRVPVSDEGILHDADTPEDYRALLQYHNQQLIRPVVNVVLTREKPFFDSRTAMLLQQVEEAGSVRLACQRMQLSYSAGWNTIRALESQLDKPLIVRSQGGAGNRRSRLTEYGKKLLELYEDYTSAVRDSAGQLFEEIFRDVF